MFSIQTKDIYESAYYLTRGACIDKIEILKENNKQICQFNFSGDNILNDQNDYFNSKAIVNLWDFRRCYNRITSLIGSAKKRSKSGGVQ